MKIELDRKDLEALVKGSDPVYEIFNNPLMKKAGHEYYDQSGSTYWRTLEKLSEEELYLLYLLCKNK